MIKVRPGLIAAAAAFVLSLLIGLVTGAGIYALARALVFALFFFVLANLLYVIAGKFLPELLEMASAASGQSEPGGEEGPGSRINISVDGDVSGNYTSPSRGSFSGDGEFDPGAPIPGLALDQLSEDGYTEKGAAVPETPDFADGAFMDGDFSEDEAGSPAVFPGGAAAPESGPSAPEAPVLNGAAALPGAEGAESMDMLPDFEAMSQDFLASTRKAEQSGGGDEGGDAGPFDGGGFQGGTRDDVFEVSLSGQRREPVPYEGNKPAALEGDFQPKDVAQAIQTLLKRDQQ